MAYQWQPDRTAYLLETSAFISAFLQEQDLYPPFSTEQYAQGFREMSKLSGEGVIAEAVVDYVVNHPADLIIVGGIRQKVVDQALEGTFGEKYLKVGVQAGFRERLRNYRNSSKAGANSMTWEKFLQLNRFPNELEVPALMESADVTIHNNGTEEAFWDQIRTQLYFKHLYQGVLPPWQAMFNQAMSAAGLFP